MAKKEDHDIYTDDYIAIYLKSGKMRVQLKLGSSQNATLKVQQTAGLDDGKWHTVDIFHEKQVFSFLCCKSFQYCPLQ